MTDTVQNNPARAGQQRVAILAAVPQVLQQLGVQPTSVFERLGVSTDLLSDPDRFIPYSLMGALLAECCAATRSSHFALVLGAAADWRTLGAVGELMVHASTLGSALSDYVTHQDRASSGASAYLRRSQDGAIAGYGIYEPATPAHEQIYALISSVSVALISSLTAGAAKPEAMLLSFREPRDPGPYYARFQCPVHFDQPETGLVLSGRSMSLPVVRSDKARYAQLKASLPDRLPDLRPGPPWSRRVLHLIRPLLARGQATTADVAAELGLSVKTLSRKLAAEQTSFGTLLDEVRYGQARELLAITRLPVSEIGEALAYANPSAFVRSFRRWSGTTPEQWRKERKHAGTQPDVSSLPPMH